MEDRKEKGHCGICDSPLASFTCACTAPPTYFCDVCLPDHLRIPDLIHIPMSTFLVQDRGTSMAQSYPCSECAIREAMHVCICSIAQGKMYCEPCYNFHCAQGRHALHYKLPLSARKAVVDSGLSTDQFLKRQKFIDALREKLRENLSKVESLVAETQREFETALKQLMDEKSKRMKDLQTLREEVTHLITDAEEAIELLRYRTDFVADTFFEELVLSGWKQQYDYSWHVVELFTAVVDIKAVKNAIARCVKVTRNFTGFAESPEMRLLAIARKNTVTQLLLPNCSASTVTIPTTAIDVASALCLVDHESIISCGGAAHNKVYLLKLSTQEITPLSPMSQIRGYAGLIRFCDFLLVFGGTSDAAALSSAEKLDLKSTAWHQILPRMIEPRAGVTPTHYRDSIYIVGGFGKRSVEAFHLDSEKFVLMSIALPATIACVSFENNEELVVVQGDALLQWTVGESEFRQREIEKLGDGWCCVTPVVVGWEVFFVQCNSESSCDVLKCDLSAGFVTKVRSVDL